MNSISRLLLLGSLLVSQMTSAAEFAWQKDYAKVLLNGDLEWAPEPSVHQAAGEVRYIDFESGNDSNPGTQAAPWKHHPWDPNATGQAKAGKADTYVFKGGVIYRGSLSIPKGLSGTPETPVRLTRDPAWGRGEAVLSGSEIVTGWTRGSAHPDIPEADKVWTAEVDFQPRNLWLTNAEGQVRRIPLARTPNWEKSDPYDPMSEWWEWENPQWWKHNVPDARAKTERKNWGVVGIDRKNLTEDKDYYEGAVVRTEWGIVMGMPMPTEVEHFDPQTKTLSFSTPFLGAGRIIAGHRYFLENKPQYLDSAGEFWVESTGRDSARIHLRLPGDADPNRFAVEAAKHVNLIDGSSAAHLELSGLTLQFTNTPWRYWDYNFMDKDLLGAAFRILGPAQDVTVRNCNFRHVQKAILIEAQAGNQDIDAISINDNNIQFVEHGAIHLFCTRPRKSNDPADFSRLGSIEILRNNLYEIAFRFPKMGHEHAIHARYPEMAHVAGNIIERTGQAGMDISGLKGHGQPVDAPYARIIIHQNKITDSILMSNDWGALYINQGGPGYIFNNLVRNPGGFANWKLKPDMEGTPRFGHSYYVDGGYQKYLFNNIAWGRNNEQGNKYANESAFQTLVSFQNQIFNNTAYRFVQASRNQTNQLGRWQYLGNIYDDVSQYVFRHGKPAKGDADVNEAHAAEGRLSDDWDYATVGYARNAFHDITGAYAVFDSSGKVYQTLPGFRDALETVKPLAASVGLQSDTPLLRDPAKGDMRPTESVPASAAKVFAPWALYANVGEWHFWRDNADPTNIIDTHWYMQPPYPERQFYIEMPRYPLAAEWATADDYISGPLENWTDGALRFTGQPAVLSAEALNQGASYEHKKKGPVSVPASAFKTADMDTNSFLVEIVFQAAQPGGTLVEKASSGLGYQLSLDEQSRPVFTLGSGGQVARLTGSNPLGDGWHHLLAEADRANGELRFYLDGKPMAETALDLPAEASLANAAPLLIGKGFHGAIDFLRISRGTLADAHTTIEELYAWQFDGPFLKDFTGKPRNFETSPAGALDF